MLPVLQICGRGMDLPEYLRNFEFFEAFACVFVDPLTLPVVSLLVYAGIAIPITLRTGSVMIPTILLVITGGATFAAIGAPGVTIGTVVLLVAPPGVLTLLLYAYSR